MTYLVEKGEILPLCAYDGKIYINVLTGDVIDNSKTLNFLHNGLKNKSIKKVDMELSVSMIYEQSDINNDIYLIGYDYIINGVDNFLDYKCQPYGESYIASIIKGISTGTYKVKEVWTGE